jgi:DNA helicase IV
MAKLVERHYLSKEPGKVLTLPEGLVYVDPFGRKRVTLNFPARGGKMIKTSQVEIQQFIEGVKDKDGEFEHKGNRYKTLPCRAFMREVIERIPTPEEIKAREIKKKQDATLAAYKDLVNKPGVNIDFSKMSDSELRDMAQNIGASTSEAGKKLSAADIAKAIEQKIFGKAE